MNVKYTKILEELEAQFSGQAEKIGLTAKQIEFLESLQLQKKKGTF